MTLNATMPNTESATDFLQVLNNVHTSLSFTMELQLDGSIPFLGTVLTRCGGTLTTEVFGKPTDTGLLFHFQSQVNSRYKKGLVNRMVNCAYQFYLPPKNHAYQFCLPPKKDLQKNATSYAPCFQSCAI